MTHPRITAFLVVVVTTGAVAQQPTPEIKKPAEAGFVQLFNGKDLTGWKTHPDDPTKWEVKDGVISASGQGNGHLYSERGDYENCVFRIEAKINDGGNSGQY